MGSMSTHFGFALLLLAVPLGLHGWRKAGWHDVVSGTPTTAVRQIDESGLVELKGTVHADGLLESPIGGRECVFAVWTVEQWDETGENGSWTTVATGITAMPFELDDGSDRVTVDVGSRSSSGGSLTDVNDMLDESSVAVDDVLCVFGRFPVVTRHGPDAPPQRIREFTARHRTISEPTDLLLDRFDRGTPHGMRRYYEQVVAPGDDIYLLGEVDPDPGATRPLHPEDVTVRVPEEDEFVLSDLPEERLNERLGRDRLYLPLAVLLAVVGAVLVFGLPAWSG